VIVVDQSKWHRPKAVSPHLVNPVSHVVRGHLYDFRGGLPLFDLHLHEDIELSGVFSAISCVDDSVDAFRKVDHRNGFGSLVVD